MTSLRSGFQLVKRFAKNYLPFTVPNGTDSWRSRNTALKWPREARYDFREIYRTQNSFASSPRIMLMIRLRPLWRLTQGRRQRLRRHSAAIQPGYQIEFETARPLLHFSKADLLRLQRAPAYVSEKMPPIVTQNISRTRFALNCYNSSPFPSRDRTPHSPVANTVTADADLPHNILRLG